MFPRMFKISKLCSFVSMTPDLSHRCSTLSGKLSFSHLSLFLKYLILHPTSWPYKSFFYCMQYTILSLDQFLFSWDGLSTSHYHNILPLVFSIQSFRGLLQIRTVYLLMDVYIKGIAWFIRKIPRIRKTEKLLV